jgi:hypothetical protein
MEKKGFTGKLEHYGYETHYVLEIEGSNGNWYRVTERDFRSYNGKRRYTYPGKTEIGNPFQELTTEDYYGPSYFFETNTTYDPTKFEKCTIVYQPGGERGQSTKTSISGL